MVLLLFSLFAILVILIYVSLILYFYKGWKSIPSFFYIENIGEAFISIIVPFRNEEKNLPHLLDDLSKQDIDINKFEIIFVNDHSDDLSVDVVNGQNQYFSNLKLLNLTTNQNGKKTALLEAIKIAKGDIIVTLDADCRIGENWLACISSFYHRYQPDMIIMPVFFGESKNIINNMISLEFLSLIASGAGAVGIHKPVMCNGANMAFKKECFANLNNPLHSQVESGDDIFLMQNIKRNAGKILFLKSLSAVAFTSNTSSFFEFLNQRKRWISKSKYYRDPDIIVVALIVFMTSFILSCLFIGLFFYLFLGSLFILLFCIKSIADWILLSSFARFFKQEKILKYFFPSQLVYFFYITFITIYGNIGKYQWKQRKLWPGQMKY
jgi:cellulose synthase/poly-beta-1,6-N-acetylglucosamine synthase-like glycosyltransferase